MFCCLQSGFFSCPVCFQCKVNPAAAIAEDKLYICIRVFIKQKLHVNRFKFRSSVIVVCAHPLSYFSQDICRFFMNKISAFTNIKDAETLNLTNNVTNMTTSCHNK